MEIHERFTQLIRETGALAEVSPMPADHCPDVTWNHRMITYPRSGHHMLAAALLLYYNLSGANYCEYHQCCQTYPCTKKSPVFLHKDHDFDLSAPVFTNHNPLSRLLHALLGRHRDDHNVIIGIRHPYDAILSWYKISDKEQDFVTFTREKSEFYVRFAEKWALCEETNRYVYEYLDLVSHFTLIFPEILRQLTPHHRIDKDRVEALRRTVHKDAVRPKPYDYDTPEARKACTAVVGDCLTQIRRRHSFDLQSLYLES